MRRSLSRKRRSTARDDGVYLRTMPRLLVDDVTQELPPVSPMSPAARRMLRAQLFGRESDITTESCPSHPMASADTTGISTDNAHAERSSIDVKIAITMLEELRKTANPTELAALQRALHPQVRQDERPSTAPSSLERSLTRRRSLYKPGEATRIEQVKQCVPARQDAAESSAPADNKIQSSKKLVRPSLDRAVTPGDLDASYLGVHALGSLRVTNGIAPTPSPRPIEEALDLSRTVQLPKEDDHFAIPTKQIVDEDTEHISAEVPQSQNMTEIEDVSTAPEVGISLPGQGSTSDSSRSPALPPSSSPASRSSVLVGHRRHAQERGHTTDLHFDHMVSPFSVSSCESTPASYLEVRPTHDRSEGVLIDESLSPSQGLDSDDLLVVTTSHERGRSPAKSPDHLPVKEARLRLSDSAYGSRTSFDRIEPLQAEIVYKQRPAVLVHVSPERSHSNHSIDTLPTNASSNSSVNDGQSGHLTVMPQQHDNGSTSTLSTEPRARSFDVNPRPVLSQSQPSSQSLPLTTSTSPSGPRKLQKPRPVPPRHPTDDLVVQGRLNSIKGVPDLPQDLIDAHTTRIEANPEMEHLEKTHHSLAHKNSAESLKDDVKPTSIPFRFPSPTPTVQVTERERRSFGRGRRPDIPVTNREQKSFFRSLSRPRRKSGNNTTTKQEHHEDVQLTVNDFRDAVGVLGASPYDCASPARSRKNSVQKDAGSKVVLHPHQISSSASSPEKKRGRRGAEGMTAEDATMMAMRRSRDRSSSAYKEQQASEKKGTRSPERLGGQDEGRRLVDAGKSGRSAEGRVPPMPVMPAQATNKPPSALRLRQRPTTVDAGTTSTTAPARDLLEADRAPSAPTAMPTAKDQSTSTAWGEVASKWRKNRQSLDAKAAQSTILTTANTPALPQSRHPTTKTTSYNIPLPPLPPAHSSKYSTARPSHKHTTSLPTPPQLPPLSFELDLGPSFDTSSLSAELAADDARPGMMSREVSWMDDFYASSSPKTTKPGSRATDPATGPEVDVPKSSQQDPVQTPSEQAPKSTQETSTSATFNIKEDMPQHKMRIVSVGGETQLHGPRPVTGLAKMVPMMLRGERWNE